MLHGLLFIAVCLSSVICVYADTLDEALQYTYRHNHRILSEYSSYDATVRGMGKARAGFLPNVGFNLISTFYDHGDYMHSNAGHAAMNYKDSNILGMHADYTFNTGGSVIHQYIRADNMRKAAYSNLTNRVQEIILEAVRAYMAVIESDQVLRLAKKNTVILARHLELTNDKFTLGEVTKTDVAQTQSRLSLAKARELRYENNYADSIANYRRIVGKEPVRLTMPDKIPFIEDDIDKAIKTARDNNHGIAAAFYRYKAEKHAVNAALGGLMPNIIFDYGHFFKDFDTDLALTSHNRLTVTLNIPILAHGGANLASYAEQKSSMHKSLHDHREVIASVDAAVVSSVSGVRIAKANIIASSDAVEAAETALKGVSEENLLGTRTNMDLLNAEQDLFGAEVELVRARAAHVIAVYKTMAVLGLMDDIFIQNK